MRRGVGLVWSGGDGKARARGELCLPDCNPRSEGQVSLLALPGLGMREAVHTPWKNKSKIWRVLTNRALTGILTALQRHYTVGTLSGCGTASRFSLAKQRAGRWGKWQKPQVLSWLSFWFNPSWELRCLITLSCARMPALEALAAIQCLEWKDFLTRTFLDVQWNMGFELAIFASFSPSLPQIFIKPLLCANHLDMVYGQWNNQPFFVVIN